MNIYIYIYIKKQDGSHEPGSSHVFLDHILVETLLEVLLE